VVEAVNGQVEPQEQAELAVVVLAVSQDLLLLVLE
jgi:hypothetical protein